MSSSTSVSSRIRAVRKGDKDAVERICDRYYDQLAEVARRRIDGPMRRVADEFAIANDALHEFFQRAAQGDFENVTGRHDLLPLLIRLTHDRIIDEVRRLHAQKRGGGRTRGHSIFRQAGDPGGDPFDRFCGAVDSPSTRQIVSDEIRSVLERLPDQTMKSVLLLRAEGYTNEEIATALDVSLATVERKRRRIRDILEDLQGGE